MKSTIISFSFIIWATLAISQDSKPVSWEFKVSKNEDATYSFTATAKMKGDWAIYSQHTGEGGPIPLKFNFEDGVELIGVTIEESEAIKKISELFDVEVIKFKKEATFTQLFRANKDQLSFKGSLKFMCCDSQKCLPPTDVPFDIAL
jgi:thiol:disulfide interchange protein DsbD